MGLLIKDKNMDPDLKDHLYREILQCYKTRYSLPFHNDRETDDTSRNKSGYCEENFIQQEVETFLTLLLAHHLKLTLCPGSR